MSEEKPEQEDLWIVSSHFKEDLGWLRGSDVPVVVVSKATSVESEGFHAVHQIPNRGFEFGSYLWFICNYWDSMPRKVAFLHGHEKSHHQSLPILGAVSRFRNSELQGLNGPRYSIYHYFADHLWFGTDFPGMWSDFGLAAFSDCPESVVCQGATQCVISRDLIRSRPHGFYARILDEIMKRPDHRIVALFLEVAWYAMFGRPAIDLSVFVPEFDAHCRSRGESILLTSPNQVWASSMDSTVMFQEVESESEWVSLCLGILAL